MIFWAKKDPITGNDVPAVVSAETPMPVTLASAPGGAPLPTNTLRAFSGAPFAQAVSASSASVVLPVGATALHINVVGCNARIRFGEGAQTAVATDLRILDGAIYDLAVPAGATHMGIIGDGGTGTLSGDALVG